MYAFVDVHDEFHRRAVEVVHASRGPLLVPVLVVGEACFLLHRRLGSRAEALFLADVGESDFTVADVPASDWIRVGELVATYADLPLGTVDASVVATAERLGVTAVATTDRRHFSVVRPAHADAWELPLLD